MRALITIFALSFTLAVPPVLAQVEPAPTGQSGSITPTDNRCERLLFSVFNLLTSPWGLAQKAWAYVTAPKTVKDFDNQAFNDAKSKYLELLTAGKPLSLPKTFEEELAYMESMSEQSKILPLSLGEILESGTIESKNRVARAFKKLDFEKGLVDSQVAQAITTLYDAQYQAPGVFWGKKAIDQGILKRVQNDLMLRGLATQLGPLAKWSQDPNRGKYSTKGFQGALSIVINLALYASAWKAGAAHLPFTPAMIRKDIPPTLLTAIEKDGLEPHLEELKKLLSTNVVWGNFYPKLRRFYLIASSVYYAYFAFGIYEQYQLQKNLQEEPPTEEVLNASALKSTFKQLETVHEITSEEYQAWTQ